MSIKKFVCAVTLAAFMSVSVGGCYGKNAMFNAVHNWNGSLGNKFIVSFVHLILWVLPIYEISMFVDFVLLNVIEFWLGSNPMAMGDIYEETDANGNKVYAVKNPDGTLSVSLTAADGKKADFMLVRNDNEISFVSAEGVVLAKQTHGADGAVIARQIFNVDGTLMAMGAAQ